MRITILRTKLSHHLQEENMRQAMLMNNKNPVNRAPHSTLVIFISHPLEPGWDRRVLFKERVLGAKGVVVDGVDRDGKRIHLKLGASSARHSSREVMSVGVVGREQPAAQCTVELYLQYGIGAPTTEVG